MTHQTYPLSAAPRTLQGKKVKQLRDQGIVPGVMYGHQIEPVMLQVPAKALQKTIADAGFSSLVDLTIEGSNKERVLIHDLETDPVTDAVIHVDFFKVRLDQKTKAEVELNFVGVSPAVKDLAGILVKNLSTVEVEALPQDLPHDLEIDISKLATFDDLIHARDIVLPAGVELMIDGDLVVANVTPPRSEEEIKALDSEVVEDVTKVESAKKEKPEGEEGEAGEEAAAPAGDADKGEKKE